MLGESWPLVGAEAMRGLDRHSIEKLGIDGELLMESAGRAVVRAVLEERAPGGSVLVVCGIGNNGGDGFVVARHLHQLGVPVRIELVGDAKRLQGDAAANWARCQALDVPLAPARPRVESGDVIVDALFGTGLTRNVEGPARQAIQRIAKAPSGVRVVAVDLPSGIDADTGAILGTAVDADVTVTIGLPKLGLALEPGRGQAGRIRVARIGIDDEAPGITAPARLLTRAGVGAALPLRPAHGHKGTFGHVLVLAGSVGKTGAAALAARGAARTGGGLVTVGCPASLNPILEAKLTEPMTVPLPETAGQTLAASGRDEILELAAARDAVVLGPGIGRDPEVLALVRELVAAISKPLVLDADGLMAFASEPGVLAQRDAPTIVTPHPGEASSLLGPSAAEINANRPAAARDLANRTGSVVVLKGAATVIADIEQLCINPTGGPVLGAGGSGDVLAGVLASLLGQGAEPFEAAALGVFAHGLAADRLAAERGDAGLLASEIADALPETLAHLRAGASSAPLPAADVLDFPEPR
ncbi:MAG: NAD(P)H-hydrate dehydratase [Myxococcota bacterium]|nr:NAD(P)H-hydrate dehydratase [Myxococcota bacterium]